MKMPVATWTRENQQPNDPPVIDYVDIEPQQQKPTGSVNGIRAKSELGLSGDVVMKLASTLPEARQVRLPNCNLEEEKSVKKKGEEALTVRVETTHNIVLSKAMQASDSEALDELDIDSTRQEVISTPPGHKDNEMDFQKRLQE
ncbi:hypothetical protein JOQ06_016537 [Pogonophryne albipinna]|uniref:Uncharacterized protein n=1 Tax=Pogonophryne albipinna TaxID=1090488 RepID=A0AAD6AAB6_9TELE|nr:hypothetical protein JOQ06_016537 [Pogonophryne albipinna]